MTKADDDRDGRFADLLARYEQSLAGAATSNELSAAENELDGELAAEFARATACLDLIDRVRRHWSPLASDETPPLESPFDTPRDAPLGLGRFQIVRPLGRGGHGMVYLAYDARLRRQVALKVPRPEALASDDLRRRFLREAEAAAVLAHPNLVPVYEAGAAGPVCYIAAEFCAGPNLHEWLRRHPSGLEIDVAARLGRDLALAVQHAHGRGVLHRDLKPSNVLLELPPEGAAAPFVPKLTDFGMAKLLAQASDDTRSGALIGTHAYMAPEQAQGQAARLDARTDVFGLGAILYECLTARAPNAGATEVDALRAALFEEPPAPRAIRPEIPRDLEAIVQKCLARRPADRYVTAQQLADDLDRFLAGNPTEARPLGAVGRLGKWARRRPAQAAFAGVLAAAAVALAGTVLVYNARLSAAAARADAARAVAEREVAASRRLLYAADVRRAAEAFKADDALNALEALDRSIPRPGEEDLREFTWHYLRGQCAGNSRPLIGHDRPVMTVAFSPDGRLLASGGEDGTARLWDAATGKPRGVIRDETIEVVAVAFSRDGRVLACGNENGTIGLWEVASVTKIRTLAGHRGYVLALAFSPDGESLASGGVDTTVRLWNLASGEATATLPLGQDAVRRLAYAPSGAVLYAVDETHQVHSWRTSDHARAAVTQSEFEKLFALAISPDGSQLATAGSLREIGLWRPGDDALARQPGFAPRHSEWIQALAFSPDNKTLVSAGKDRVMHLWQPGRPHPLRTLHGNSGEVRSLDWSPDGRMLASGGADGVRLWEVARGSTIEPYPHGDMGRPWDAQFAAGDLRLLTAHADGMLRIWDAKRRVLLAEHGFLKQQADKLCVSPDGELIALATTPPGVKVFRLDPWSEVMLPPDCAGVIAWAPRGHRLATRLDDTTVAIIDVDAGTIERRFVHSAPVRRAAFTPDGRLAATASDGLYLWNCQSGESTVFRRSDGHDRLAVSPDGRWIAASSSARVTLVDRAFNNARATLTTAGQDDPRLAIHGNTLAVGIKNPAVVSLWDLRTRQELARLECGGQNLHSVCFSTDGKRLVATGIDDQKRGRLWEWSIDD